jgi:ABC-type multidrug transport system ATPase subunit
MSGGEQQRVAIAVALVNRPNLLLADEPTGEVDEANAKMIYQIFRDLNTELNLTTLIVSHDVGLARHVDRVIAIRDGKIATETVRKAGNSKGQASVGSKSMEESLDDEQHFTELTVLDSAGRLQIPKEYREHFEIRRRVQLELQDEGILIRPVDQMDKGEDAEAIVTDMVEAKRTNRFQKLVGNWKSKLGRNQ